MKPMSLYDHDSGRFTILDLIAHFRFKSLSSTSFDLSTEADSFSFPDGTKIPAPRGLVFNMVGSVDVHHPCDGHIKAIFRFVLPAQYHEYETMNELVRLMLAALQIPSDETYEAYFMSPEHRALIEQVTDRNGMTYRIY